MNALKLALFRIVTEVTLRRCTTQSPLLSEGRGLLGTKIHAKALLDAILIRVNVPVLYSYTSDIFGHNLETI